MLCPKPVRAGLTAAGATALLALAAFGIAELRQHTSVMPSFFGPTALLTLAAAILIYGYLYPPIRLTVCLQSETTEDKLDRDAHDVGQS